MSTTITLKNTEEAIIGKMIERGYAATREEVVRRALADAEKAAEKEEIECVKAAIECDMSEIRSGKARTYTSEEVKKRFGF